MRDAVVHTLTICCSGNRVVELFIIVVIQSSALHRHVYKLAVYVFSLVVVKLFAFHQFVTV